MIQLTKELAMIADDHCYIVGKPKQSPGKPVEMRQPTYYSTAAQAVQSALQRTILKAVKDGNITTLREFIQEQDRQRTELEKRIAPLRLRGETVQDVREGLSSRWEG